MKRLRTFAAAHKALRNILSQFSTRAGQTNYESPDEVNQLKSLGNEMFLMLEEHVVIENEYVLKPLEERVPGASDHDLQEHEEIEESQALLKASMSMLSGYDDETIGHQFYLDFTQFQSRYLLHILHEEMETEKLLWDNFTDKELFDIKMNIIKSIPPDMQLIWWKYMIPAQNEIENIAMLSAIRIQSPVMFEETLRVIDPFISRQRLEKLIEKCTHQAVL